MKRPLSSDTTFFIQVKLDETIMDKNPFLSQKKEFFSMKDIISLLPRNLTRDDLIDLHKELGDEITNRTTTACEMIPDEVWDDIWKRVFQLIAKDDISKAFPLKQVCKRWESTFADAIDEVRVQHEDSLEQIYSLTSLRSLTIKTEAKINDEIFSNLFLKLDRLTLLHEDINSSLYKSKLIEMTNLKSLDLTDFFSSLQRKKFINFNNLSSLVNLEYLKFGQIHDNPYRCVKELVNLKELDISEFSYFPEDLKIEFGPNLDIINHLPKLKIFSICISFENASDRDSFKINQVQNLYPHVRFRWVITNDEGDIDGIYEGSFSEDNKMNGKGKKSYFRGATYEGEFKNDKKEGEGVYTWPSDDDRSTEQPDGEGLLYLPSRNRFEGDFKNDKCYLGIMYYCNGNRYEGEINDEDRGGKGVMIYSNGNRYEGIFENGQRVGEGVFYYSNGEKVEGDESKYILKENEGIIEILASSTSCIPSPQYSFL